MSLYHSAWAIAFVACVLAPCFCSLFGSRATYEPVDGRNCEPSNPHDGETR